jgi:hypothetical protein
MAPNATKNAKNTPPAITAATAATPITIPDAVRAGSSNRAGIVGCVSVTMVLS